MEFLWLAKLAGILQLSERGGSVQMSSCNLLFLTWQTINEPEDKESKALCTTAQNHGQMIDTTTIPVRWFSK